MSTSILVLLEVLLLPVSDGRALNHLYAGKALSRIVEISTRVGYWEYCLGAVVRTEEAWWIIAAGSG